MTRSHLIFAIAAAATALVCATLIYTLLTTQGTGDVAFPQHVFGATLKDRPAPTDSVAAVEPTSAPVSLATSTGALIPAPAIPEASAGRTVATDGLSDDEALWQIASRESGVIGRNSGNGYYGAWQISAGWLERHGYAYGTGSGGVGDPENPNQALEYEAAYTYCMERYGSTQAALAHQQIHGWY